jgi:hypothetical protein
LATLAAFATGDALGDSEVKRVCDALGVAFLAEPKKVWAAPVSVTVVVFLADFTGVAFLADFTGVAFLADFTAGDALGDSEVNRVCDAWRPGVTRLVTRTGVARLGAALATS